MIELALLAAQTSEEGGGVEINLGIIALVLIAVSALVLAVRRRR